MRTLNAYCDAACGHEGTSGAAYAVTENGRSMDKGAQRLWCTANEAEMRSVLMALEALCVAGAGSGDIITVFTDFKPLCDAFSEGWLSKWERNGWKNSEGSPVKHQELWQEIHARSTSLGAQIRYLKKDASGMLGRLKKMAREAV